MTTTMIHHKIGPELNAEPGDRDEDTVVADIDGNGGGTLSIVAGHELPDNVNVCAPTKLNVAGPSAPAMAKITFVELEVEKECGTDPNSSPFRWWAVEVQRQMSTHFAKCP
jgi:hypothetical protein